MKEKKGFTLVELLGVIAIIAVILAFAVPSIVGMLKRDSEKEYQRFLNDLYLATESYVQINIDNYPNLSTSGGNYTILLKQLIDNGFIDSSKINPKTKQKIKTSDMIKIIKKSEGGYEYQYIENE